MVAKTFVNKLTPSLLALGFLSTGTAQAMSPPYCALFDAPDLGGKLQMLYPESDGAPDLGIQIRDGVGSAWIAPGFTIDVYSERAFGGTKHTVAKPLGDDARYKKNGDGVYINFADLTHEPVLSAICH